MTINTTAHLTRDALDISYRHVTTHFIDGTYQPSHGQDIIEVTDPATNTVWGSVPVGNQDDVDAAVEAAHAAFTTGPWADTTPTQRAETLLRIADEIEARTKELSLTNTLENGSPVAETSGAAANAASIFRYFATLAPELEADDVRPFPNGQGDSLVRKDPVGVCALIAPWNFPINLMVTKLAPALLAGCAVVMKPASPTPLSFRIIVDAMTAAGVPAGVVNLVTGPGRMGDLMVRHPKVAKVAFTGSTPVGRHIAAACGELLRPVTLELGGKSSAIVMEDADLDEAISLANNTEFGLGGIVFGTDQNQALEVAEAINTGSIGLNFFASNHAAPFGGRNDSGLGVEYGPEGLAAYLSYKSIHRR